MTDVHGEEEYFDTRFLNLLPDGSIFLDGEESKEKEIDCTLHPVFPGDPSPSKFAYSLRENERRKKEKKVMLEMQNDYFLTSTAAISLSNQSFQLKRPFWEFMYKNGDGDTVEEQVCRIQIGCSERVYYSHRVLPNQRRTVKYKEFMVGDDCGEKYDIEVFC